MGTKLIPDGQPMSQSTIARRRKAAGLTKPQVKSEVDEGFFNTWSPELAWLIGLIWSDGCIYGNTIEISSKDFQLIDLILSLIKGKYALKNRGKHLRIHFSSRVVAGFLRSIGLTERKSLTVQWPQIPESLNAHFMRGLIDGDGSVIIRNNRKGQQVSDLNVQLVTASPNLKNDVAEWFSSNGIRYRLDFRNTGNGLWRFTVVSQDSLKRLHHLLYPIEDVVCLHRKRIPFDAWMETPRVRPGRPKG